ncbi:predicted protein [Arabidopsis lyrata subsp. lyrata]|uniref:Predicted protein n=1 Tax=Arabidopsis lyrata subsp. lyrata TaxID=81972 RepID=D7L4H7_ARALL|nr:predicted protein [Arabidopsis lyrata subsp. lyrata]
MSKRFELRKDKTLSDTNIETTTIFQISDAGKAFACRRRIVPSIFASFVANFDSVVLLESSFPAAPFSNFTLRRKASKPVTGDSYPPQRVQLFVADVFSLLPANPDIFSVLNRRLYSIHSVIFHRSPLSVATLQIRHVSLANLCFRHLPMDYLSRSISGFTSDASFCFILPELILHLSFKVPESFLRKSSFSTVASRICLITLKICPCNLLISLVMRGQESFSAVSQRSIPVIPRLYRALLPFPVVSLTGGHIDSGSDGCASRKIILGQTPLFGLQRGNSSWAWPMSVLIWILPAPFHFVGLKLLWPIRRVKANWDCLCKYELWAHVGPNNYVGSLPTYSKLWGFAVVFWKLCQDCNGVSRTSY